MIGAVINLGNCLDLLDYENLKLLKFGYDILISTSNKLNKPLPINKSAGNIKELMLRELDCSVFETLHKVRIENKMTSFDSVRGVFLEGEEIYPNAGFKEKNHIQLCIRNPNCIKGVFLPRQLNDSFPKV